MSLGRGALLSLACLALVSLALLVSVYMLVRRVAEGRAGTILEQAIVAHGLAGPARADPLEGQVDEIVHVVGPRPTDAVYSVVFWWKGRWVGESTQEGPLHLSWTTNGTSGRDSLGVASAPLWPDQCRVNMATWIRRNPVFLLRRLQGMTAVAKGICILPDGERTDEIHCAGWAGGGIEVFFSRRTGLLAAVRSCTLGSTSLCLYRGYRRINGIMLPFRWNRYEAGQLVETGTVKQLTYTLVHGRLSTGAPAEKVRSCTVPLRVLGNGVVVRASINGQPAEPFLVSTEDQTSEVFRGTTLASSLRPTWRGTLTLRPGWVLDSYAVAKSITIGTVSARQVVVGIVDPGRDRSPTLAGCVGVIGLDFIEQYCVTINYGGCTMTLGADVPPNAELGVHMDMGSGWAYVQATVGHARMWMMVDTANAVWLPEREIGRSGSWPDCTVCSLGGGGRTWRDVTVSRLSVGNVAVQNVAAYLPTPERGVSEVAPDRGILGWGFLRHFVVTIDYPHATLYLSAPCAVSAAP